MVDRHFSGAHRLLVRGDRYQQRFIRYLVHQLAIHSVTPCGSISRSSLRGLHKALFGLYKAFPQFLQLLTITSVLLGLSTLRADCRGSRIFSHVRRLLHPQWLIWLMDKGPSASASMSLLASQMVSLVSSSDRRGLVYTLFNQEDF